MAPLRRLLAVTVVAGAVAAGCSSGGAEQAATTTSTAAEAAPERGGILRLAIERPASLDPAEARSVPQSELVVADLLYDGLTAYDPEAGEAVPALASGWEADDTATTWRFTVDPDATFADGRSVRATDVTASFERVAAGGADSPGARLLAVVAGVAVEGEDVVAITLTRPLSSLPELLSSPLLGVAPADATAASLAGVPAGSGPFRPAAGAVGEEEDLLASGTLRLERVPGGDAMVDGVDLVLVEDAGDALDLVARGDADAAFVPTDVGRLGEGLDSVSAPFGAELFYGLHLGSPKLADPRLREAIVAAVDREAIIDEAYGGALEPLAGVVPDDVPGGAPAGCGGPCEHDPARARTLVEAAFPDGGVPELFVDVDAGERQEEVAAAIAADLEAVGIPATVRVHEIDEYPTFLASGQHEVFRLGWSGGWPSAEAYLSPLFRSGAPENVVGLAIPAVDEALDRAARALDPAERDEVYAEAEALVLAELPVLPIGQFRTRVALGERVRGLDLSVTGTFDVTTVHLVGDR